MKTSLYANIAEPKSISVISILVLAAVGDITKLRCMHRECYIFASQNRWYIYTIVYTYILHVFGFRITNNTHAYKAIGRPYIYEINFVH